MEKTWENKRVLITGITGFIGGNLAAELIHSGAMVFGVLRNENPRCYLYAEGLHKQVCLVRSDLMDYVRLLNIITENQIQVIYHLAAQVEVGVGITNPFLTFETNIRGTYNLLEACRLASLSGNRPEAIIVASSDKAYGEYPKEKMPYRETYPLMPKYPYDTSKACADMICQAYSVDSFNLPVIVSRFSNIYGPGQLNFSALVPDAIRSALGYSKFIPRSDGNMVRDFLFVKDVVGLYKIMAEYCSANPELLRGEIFNAGSNKPVSVRYMLSEIFRSVGKVQELNEITEKMKDRKTVGEIQYQHMSFEKVKEFFGWTPEWSIEKGIHETVAWYEKYLKSIRA